MQMKNELIHPTLLMALLMAQMLVNSAGHMAYDMPVAAAGMDIVAGSTELAH